MYAFHSFSFQNLRNSLWCAVFVLLLAVSSPVSAETVTVDFGADKGAATVRGIGFLHGISATLPPDSIVLPLKPHMYRCAEWTGCFSIYARAAATGAKVQLVLSDSSGYAAPWPGDNNDWSNWLSTVTRIVNKAKANGQNFQWDIWNEPDGGFWGRPVAQFNETWRRTALLVRQLNPGATIVGPSATDNIVYVKNFLLYAKANNVLPDVVSWHHNGGDSGRQIAAEVADIRSFMAQNGINISRISINEFAGIPAMLFASFEAGQVESAAHACWESCNQANLDGMIDQTDPTRTKLSNAQEYYAWKGYAEITGRMVGVTPSTTVDGVAGYDSGNQVARLVLGRDGGVTGAVTLNLANIGSASSLIGNGRVRVTISEIKWWRGPQQVSDTTVAVSNNQVQVALPDYCTDAYSTATTCSKPLTYRTWLVTLRNPGGTTTTSDTTAPSVPGGLTASAASSSQINLSWSASTDNVGVAGYNIYRNGIQIATATGTTYANTGLAASTTYSYTVAAYDANNTSAQSVPKSVTTPAATTATALPDVVVNVLSYANGIFSATVKNIGTAATPSGVIIGVGYSVDDVYRTYGTVSGPLAAGASVTVGTQGGSYTIPNGSHTIKAHADDANRFAESNEANNTHVQPITIGTTTAMQSPYSGSPMAIPGTVNVGQYDNGGEGVAYHDLTAANNASGTYRPGQGVDTDGAGKFGWVQAGEWVEYTVKVGTSGTYNMSIPVAHPGTGGTLHVEFNGIKSATLTVPDTGGWAPAFKTLSQSVNLNAGTQVMRVAFDSNDAAGYVGDLGNIVFTAAAPTTTSLPDVIVTALTHANGIFTATVKNQGSVATPAGVQIGVGFFVDGAYKTYGFVSGALAAGASGTFNSAGSHIIPTGTHTIMAYADDANRFAEANETNNQLSKSITIGTTTTGTVTLVNFGGSATSNTFGLSGWGTVIKDVYTNYSSAGPDGTLVGANGGFNFQGIKGTARTFASGNKIQVTWYNNSSTARSITPRVSLTNASRIGYSGGYAMTTVTVPAMGTAVSTYTFTTTTAGSYSLVNVTAAVDNTTLLCDKIVLVTP